MLYRVNCLHMYLSLTQEYIYSVNLTKKDIHFTPMLTSVHVRVSLGTWINHLMQIRNAHSRKLAVTLCVPILTGQ